MSPFHFFSAGLPSARSHAAALGAGPGAPGVYWAGWAWAGSSLQIHKEWENCQSAAMTQCYNKGWTKSLWSWERFLWLIWDAHWGQDLGSCCLFLKQLQRKQDVLHWVIINLLALLSDWWACHKRFHSKWRKLFGWNNTRRCKKNLYPIFNVNGGKLSNNIQHYLLPSGYCVITRLWGREMGFNTFRRKLFLRSENLVLVRMVTWMLWRSHFLVCF